MTAEEYTVNTGKPRRKIRNFDNSFVSCMFAIFLFILLCIILLIIMFAVKWRKAAEEIETDTPTTKVYHDGHDMYERLKMNLTTSTVTTKITTTETTTTTTTMKPIVENTTVIRTTTSPPLTSEWSTIPDVLEPKIAASTDATTLATEPSSLTPDTADKVKVEKEKNTTTEEPLSEGTTYRTEPEDSSTPSADVTPLSTSSSEPVTDTITTSKGASAAPGEELSAISTSSTNDEETTTTEKDYTSNSTTSSWMESSEGNTTVSSAELTTIITMSSGVTRTTPGEELSAISTLSMSDEETITTEKDYTSNSTTDSSTESSEVNTTVSFAEMTTIMTTPSEETSTPPGEGPEISSSSESDEKSRTEKDYTSSSTTDSSTESFEENTTVSSAELTTIMTMPDEGTSTATSEELSTVSTSSGSDEALVASVRTTTTEYTSQSTTDFSESTAWTTTVPPIAATTVPPKSAEDSCDTLECKRLSGRMLAQMGHEYEPCDNFYMYACGGIHSDPFILPYDYSKDAKDRILGTIRADGYINYAFQKFANFHTSCVQAEDIETQLAIELVKLLRQIGEFNHTAKKEDLNFTHFFSEIISLHRPLLFDIIVDVDDRNNSHYILKMTTPIHDNPFLIGSNIPPACNPGNSMKNGSNLNMVYKNIKECMAEEKVKYLVNGFYRILEVLNTSDIYTTYTDHYAAAQSLEVWMSEFDKVEPVEWKRKHGVRTKDYKLVTVSDLNEKYPMINWIILLENLLGQAVPADTTLQLYSEEYYNKIFDMFKDDNNTVEIYNALLAAFVQQLYADLVTNLIPDDEYCLIVAARLMEDVAAGAYLNTFDKAELHSKKKAVEKVFRLLQNTLKQHLENADWLAADKKSMLEKLDSMTLAADGGVDVYTKLEDLDKHMKSVDVESSSTSYVKNSIALLRRYRSSIYKSYDSNPKSPANIWSHFSLPHETLGVSVFGLNTIVIPYAMLASPFFHKDYPEYLQIAGLGHVVAHEIAHHFDNIGMKYSPSGERGALLHDPALVSYRDMESCFQEEFNTTVTQQAEDGKIFTFTLDPDLHREEQLADDIATLLLYSLFKNMSYDLYQEHLPFLGLNNKETFFLHLAQGFCTKDTLHSRTVGLFEDEHLPALLRVNHLISQFKDFSEVFNCTVHSKMNPAKRCDVFPALNTVHVS